MTENANLPAVYDDAAMDYFAQYGAAASSTTIVGTMIKFAKGEWLIGKDGEEVEEGRQFTVVMDELTVGWQKWQDNKPVATDMGRVVEGFRMPDRKTLGDDDESEWEEGDDGKPRDPWQQSNLVLLRTPGTNGTDADDLFTFPTSAKAGINAVAELCKQYARLTKEKGSGYPIIELQTSFYMHPKYKKVWTPVLKIVGWEPKKFEEAPETKKLEKKTEAKKTEAKKPAAKEEPEKKTAGKKK